MILLTFVGVMIPFIGTALGAALVYFIKAEPGEVFKRALNGFAAGVMTAASIWSLILPAIESSERLGAFAFLPSCFGLIFGVGLLILIETLSKPFGVESKVNGLIGCDAKTKKMIFAVTLHNAPEGLAVGIVFAGYLSQNFGVTLAGAMALSVGIAIQNFPEGAIVSLPLLSSKTGKTKSFLYGVISGVIEPIAALFAILFSVFVSNMMPYFLSFAAVAMIYVVINDLIPGSKSEDAETIGTLLFFLGFIVMMALDVALG